MKIYLKDQPRDTTHDPEPPDKDREVLDEMAFNEVGDGYHIRVSKMNWYGKPCLDITQFRESIDGTVSATKKRLQFPWNDTNREHEDMLMTTIGVLLDAAQEMGIDPSEYFNIE